MTRDYADCTVCALNGAVIRMTLFMDGIRDYEYGVAWRSTLHKCPRCGLVAQVPAIAPGDISRLYPEGYGAHAPIAARNAVYAFLKRILGGLEARHLLRHAGQSAHVLEVGCGNGGFLQALIQRRPDLSVAGVDIKDCAGRDVPGLRFFQGQLEDLPIGEGSFDIVYCSNLIEHVPDPGRFLRKCHSILKEGGILICVTPDHLSLDRYLFGRYWGGYHYPRHTFVFNHRNIVSLLYATGFDTVSLLGRNAFWYISIANMLADRHAAKGRGLAFGLVSLLMAPLDWLVNRFRVHGSMTVVARKSTA